MRNNRWVVLGVGAVAACLCLVTVGALGAGYLLLRPAATLIGEIGTELATSASPPTAEPTASEPSATPTAAGTAAPVPTTAEPPPFAADLEEVQGQVENLRGLEASEAVHIEFITRVQLAEKLEQEAQEEYPEEEARDDVIALAAFGLVEPGFDLFDFLLQVQAEGILGFYEPEEHTMYVVAEGEFGGFERMTYAHEYTHFLQDQVFSFERLGVNDEACEAESERCAGLRALYEGDATLAQLIWLGEEATQQDRLDIQAAIAEFDTPVLESGPAFYSKQIEFFYGDGLEFVQGLWEAGGWEAVDAAYADPPLSTEQILHPERYPADDLLPVPAPVLTDTLGLGWRQVDAGVMGELYVRLILEEQVDSELAAEAAAGWGGDAYTVSYNEAEGQTAVVLQIVWDTAGEAEEFAVAFEEYNGLRYGGPAFRLGQASCRRGSEVSCLSFVGTETVWALGPDEATVEAILELFP